MTMTADQFAEVLAILRAMSAQMDEILCLIGQAEQKIGRIEVMLQRTA